MSTARLLDGSVTSWSAFRLRRADALFAAVAALSFVFLALGMARDLGVFDEGIVLAGAMRVAHGDVIHRDFYTNYGPGQFYAVAVLFRLFGESLLAARFYDILVRSVVLALFFRISVSQGSVGIAAVFTAVCGTWLLCVGSYLYPIFPCMLLALLGCRLLAKVGSDDRTTAVFLAGACTGLTALFRYDVGFFLLIAHLLSLTALSFIPERRAASPRSFLVKVGLYCTGVAAIFLPAALLFLRFSSLSPFYADIVDYSAKYYAAMRGLPFPGPGRIATVPSAAVVYFPLLAAAAVLLELFRRTRRTRRRTTSEVDHQGSVRRHLVVFGLTALMLFLKGTVRVSALQMMLGIVPALVVLGIVVDRWWRSGRAMQLGASALLLVVLCPTAFIASAYAHAVIGTERSLIGWFWTATGRIQPDERDADRCERASVSSFALLKLDYLMTANYLRARSRPDEPILVALDRHDKIFINPLVLYFASGRLPGTHWHQFDPGLQTRADIQAGIIGDLKGRNVRWIVRDGSFDDVAEPNGSALSGGVRLLDSYIDENYRPVARSGPVQIWLDKRQPVPASSEGDRCEAPTVHDARQDS